MAVTESADTQSVTEFSASELEAHIRDCGRLIEESMVRWHETGCFAARGDADYWKLRMYEAIATRSSETVAQLEAERGLL